MVPYVLNISVICFLVTFRVSLPMWILVGLGVGDLSFRRGLGDLDLGFSSGFFLSAAGFSFSLPFLLS